MINLIENQTVENLRKAGFKVKVVHERYPYHDAERGLTNDWEIREENLGFYPNGGKTIVTVTGNNKQYIGVAECSRKDGYNRRLGVKIALGRLKIN